MSWPWVRCAALPLILVLAACGVPQGGRPSDAEDGRPLVLAVLQLLRHDLLLFCFDPTHVRSIGLRTGGVLHYLLVSLAAVAGLQSVGIILVVAMLVPPGATAYLLTERRRHQLAVRRRPT